MFDGQRFSKGKSGKIEARHYIVRAGYCRHYIDRWFSLGCTSGCGELCDGDHDDFDRVYCDRIENHGDLHGILFDQDGIRFDITWKDK